MRLTIIKQQDQFQVIGTNLIEESKIEDEKTPLITLNQEGIEKQKTVLQLFLRNHLTAIKLKSPVDQTIFYLKHQDKQISVKMEGTEKTFDCNELVVNEAQLKVQLVGCSGGEQESYTWKYE